MKLAYCSHCLKETNPKIINREEIFKVRGEQIRVNASIAICSICNKEVFDEEIDSKNLEMAYNKYRKIHNLLFQQEIINIREKYGLSQRSLGSLLGWGDITIHRYETGALPDQAHNTLLVLLRNPENMKEIYNRNKDVLSDSVRNKTGILINQLIIEKNQSIDHKYLKKYHDINNNWNWYKRGQKEIKDENELLKELIVKFKREIHHSKWDLSIINQERESIECNVEKEEIING